MDPKSGDTSPRQPGRAGNMPASPLPPPAIDERDELSASYQSTDTVRRHPEAAGYGTQALLPVFPAFSSGAT